MKNRILLISLLFTLLLPGCIRQRPVLAAEATPRPTPTPALPAIEQTLLSEPKPLDALGAAINNDDHFLRYLKFTNLRVYEYDGGTLFDGICGNTYTKTLSGAFEVTFTDQDGNVIARAPVYPRSGVNEFPPGETVIFAEIDTDMDIQLLPFSISVTQNIAPLSTVTAAVN